MVRKLIINLATHTCLCDVARLLPHVFTQIFQVFGHLVFLDTDDSHSWRHEADLHPTPAGRGRASGSHHENTAASNPEPSDIEKNCNARVQMHMCVCRVERHLTFVIWLHISQH